MTRRLAPVALLALLCAPASARAQEPPPPVVLRLEYTRGKGTVCPDEHAVAELLHRGLAYEARPDAEQRLVITATREGGVHRVVMALWDKTGAALWGRDYRSLDCAGAVEAAVNSAALEFVQPYEPPAPAVVPPPMPPLPQIAVVSRAMPPPPVMVATPPPAPAPAPSFDLFMGADLVLGLGSTPSPTVGAGVFVAVRPVGRPALSVEVTARASWSPSAAQVGYVAVRSTFYSGQLAVCGHLRFIFLCPTIGVGALGLQLPGVGSATATSSPFAIPGARLGAEHRFAQIPVLLRGFVELEATPGLNVWIHSVTSQQWQPSAGGVVGVGVAFPP